MNKSLQKKDGETPGSIVGTPGHLKILHRHYVRNASPSQQPGCEVAGSQSVDTVHHGSQDVRWLVTLHP